MFGIKSKEERDRERDEESARRWAQKVANLRLAIASIPPGRVCDVLSSVLRDDPRLSPHDLNKLSDDLGLEAHMRCRQFKP